MKLKIKYECERCGDKYDYYEYAEECCKPEVFSVYLCPACEEPHYTEEDAKNCCPENEALLAIITAEELEEAGQARLPSL